MDVIKNALSKLLSIVKDRLVILVTVLNALMDVSTVHQLSIVPSVTFFTLLMLLHAFQTALQLLIAALVEWQINQE